MAENSYLDYLFQQILGSGQGYQNQNQRRQAHMQASEGNDAMLRDKLSYKTGRAKSDQRPQGSYVDIKYPGYERDMMDAMGGWAPKGYTTYHESTGDFDKRRDKQRDWAMQQRKMVGDSFVPDGSAVDAMWNRIHRGRRF